MARPARLVTALMLSALALSMVVCAAVAWFDVGRVDLFHLAYFDSCAMRAHQWHWQDARRHPQVFRYDFSLSPVSFVLVEIWVREGKVLKFSQSLPTNCGSISTRRNSSWS
ncbi:MAG: hypothetical protein AAB217_14995 [Chloroflexota bacterium]